jgi:hypothetical protein
MKASWTFIAGLGAGLLFIFGLTAIAFYLNLGVPSDGSRWAFEVNQKKQRLAEQTNTPKLLIVGGSATLFGIKAGEIEKQTGLRTINMGTHAALGTAYILHLVQEAAKPGDTVLLVLEYELYNYGRLEQSWADKILVDHIVARDPAYFHTLSLAEQWNVFMLTPTKRLFDGLKIRFGVNRISHDWAPGPYNSALINDWGDLTGYSKASRPQQKAEVLNWKSGLARGLPENPKGFPLIAEFCRWARTNHIRVLATYPNICDQPDYRAKVAKQVGQTIKDFFAGLDVPVIGEYSDALLPRDEFFDTNYHPTEEAAVERTKRLAAQLAPYLK